MKIVFRIPYDMEIDCTLGIDGLLADRAEICSQLGAFIRHTYESMLEPTDETCLSDITEDDFIFGAEQPETLIQLAAEWNDDIREQAYRKMQDVLRWEDHTQLPLDNTATYALRVAVAALDNSFFAFGEKAVAVAPDTEFGAVRLQPVMQEEMHFEIKNEPRAYVAVDVYPR